MEVRVIRAASMMILRIHWRRMMILMVMMVLRGVLTCNNSVNIIPVDLLRNS